MDPLTDFFNSKPAFAQEYARVQALGDKRSALQWLQGHMAASPSTAQEFADFQQQGMASFLDRYPDLKTAFDASGLTDPRQFILQWANANPNDPRLDDPGFLDSVGLESDMEDVPAEKALLDRALEDYIYPDLDRDPARRAQAQSILDRYNADIDAARALNARSLDGTRLQEEYAMADQTGARLRDSANAEAGGQLTAVNTEAGGRGTALNAEAAGQTAAINTEAGGQVSALTRLNTDRLAALAPLNAERIAAADTQVSGINQALQGERDRIAAEDALAGFVGGSSMKDSALARAVYGARQNAAETMGAARVTNAGDTRSIWDDTARGMATTEFGRLSGVRGAESNRLTGLRDNEFGRLAGGREVEFGRLSSVRNAADSTTGWRKDYFDGDFNRRMQAALTPITLEANRFGMLGAADDYGQSGLRRSQNTLNWWANEARAPSYDTFQTQADTSGNSIAGLGAGLVSAAASYGMSKMNQPTVAPNGIPIVNKWPTAPVAPKVYSKPF